MRCVTLPGGEVVPSMGQGTWKIYATARGLPDRRLTEAYLRRLTIKYGLTATAYWTAFGLAFWNWRVGLVAAGIVTLSYVIPPAKPAFRLGMESAETDS